MPTPPAATFAQLLNLTSAELRPVLIRLRERVLELDPTAQETVRLGHRALSFGVGPKPMAQGYAYLVPHAQWVNLGFYHGRVLADPDKLLVGTGKNLRHIKIHTLEEAKRPELSALLLQAIEERRKAEEE